MAQLCETSPSVDELIKFNPINEDKKQDEFRNYEDGPRQDRVSEFYFQNHKNQTLEFVLGLKERIKFQDLKMTIWEAFEMLDQVVDDSDPDTDLSQTIHGLQTAEAMRREFPDDDWFHLTGLIHDLGKVLTHPCFNLSQWAIVGDTFPVGCKFSDKNVFPQYFAHNPDSKHPVYSDKYGIYEPNCGLMNVHFSYGHDEYLYQVLVHNKCTLPLKALYIIRFHSFYAFHKEGEYRYLMDEVDHELEPWIHTFNRFDLYSKSHVPPKWEDHKAYYMGLVEKYIPGVLSW